MSPDAALRVMVGHCLTGIVPLAAAIRDGAGNPQDLHQLRVALRRLRSLLRELGGWSVDCDPSWQPALARLFGRLGQARDRQVLLDTIMPSLLAAGMPALAVAPPPTVASPASILREDDWRELCDALRGFAAGVAAAGGQHGDVRRLAGASLRRLHRRISRQADVFESLDDPSRHRLRKRVKRLRYNLELLAALFPRKPVARYIEGLQPIQDALGDYNDQLVALAWLREQAAHQPQAWFGVGWLTARQGRQLRRTAGALERFARLPQFLRRPR